MISRRLGCPASPARPAPRVAAVAAFALVLPVLAACGDASRTFGLTRDPPDEFQTLTRAPLSLPPDYNLRPPRPGAPRPQEQTAREAAREVVLGSPRPAAASAAGSAGEAALLSAASTATGGEAPAADIRDVVDEESTRLDRPSRNFVDILMFWRAPPPAGTPVDAAAEQQRLRENAALGRPITEGETPMIRPRRRAPLEGLFGR